MRGGRDEENKVRKEMADEKMAADKRHREQTREMAEKAKENRKIELRRMLDDLKVKKEGLVNQRADLTMKIQGMSKAHPDYLKTQDSIRYCDAELSAEWYKTLERNEQEN